MSARDTLDAINMVKDGRRRLRAAVEAAALPDQAIDPLLIDAALVDKLRRDSDIALDYYEEAERDER